MQAKNYPKIKTKFILKWQSSQTEGCNMQKYKGMLCRDVLQRETVVMHDLICAALRRTQLSSAVTLVWLTSVKSFSWCALLKIWVASHCWHAERED